MRISVVLLIAAVPLLGCGPSESSFDPEDPQVVAEIESQLQSAMAGAAAADADRVLASAGGEGELTFITGDVLLSGLDTIRASFEDTYANIAKQDQSTAPACARWRSGWRGRSWREPAKRDSSRTTQSGSSCPRGR
jgi:hypothetical protein